MKYTDGSSESLRNENTLMRQRIAALERMVEDQRKRLMAEGKVVHSEALFKAICGQSRHMATIIDIEGIVQHANQPARDFVNAEESEFINKPYWDTPWWAPSLEERSQIRERFQRAAKGEFVRFETTLVNADGDPRNIDFTLKPATDEDNRVICVIAEGRDITDRKRAEEAFRALAENSQDVIMRFDRAGRHLYVNPAIEDYTAIGAREFLGRTHAEMGFPADLCALWSNAITEVFDTGRVQRVEFRLPAGNWIDWLLMPEYQPNGEVETVITSARDITERKLALQQLRETEANLRVISDSVLDALVMIDHEGKVRYWNPAAQAIFGYTVDEMRGVPVHDILIPERYRARFESGFRQFQGTGEGSAVGRILELSAKRRTGEEFPIEISLSALHTKDGLKAIAVIRDITARKQAETDKMRLQEQLQQAMKMEAIGRLAGGVAHDFNNLLTTIAGNVELARMDTAPGDPRMDYLEETGKAAESAASLTRQLLAFSRGQIIEPRVLNLNDVVSNVYNMLVRLLGEDVKVQVIPGPELGAVKIDPGQFEQVLVNLAVNARDAMPHGGKLEIETANVTLDADYCSHSADLNPGEYVRLTVRDTGLGMTEEVKAHLFEPFFTTKPKGRGTGLGLATIFGAIRQAGGVIEADSELGIGTTFRVYLPRVETSPHPLGDKPRRDLPRGNETVLLVEDEDGVRELAFRILTKLGYNVLQASNGGEALLVQEAFNEPIDLLLTDVVMPGMNGRELADCLLKIRPTMKVLFSSGYTDDSFLRSGVANEIVNFIGKPYTMQALAEKVRDVLGPQNL